MKIGVNTFGLGPYLQADEKKVWEDLKTAGVGAIEPCIAFHEVYPMDEAYIAVKKLGIFDGIFPVASMPVRLAKLRSMGFEVVSFQLNETPFTIEELSNVITFMHKNNLRYCIYNFMSSSVEKIRVLSEIIREAVQMFREQGVELLFHNHDMEWHKDADTSVMEWLLENIPELRFEIDLGWTEYAGIDSLKILDQYRNRFPILHIKDIAKDGVAHAGKPFCVAPGEGILPLNEILEKAKNMDLIECGLIIDQDDSIAGDIVGDISKGIERIRTVVV